VINSKLGGIYITPIAKAVGDVRSCVSGYLNTESGLDGKLAPILRVEAKIRRHSRPTRHNAMQADWFLFVSGSPAKVGFPLPGGGLTVVHEGER